MSSNMLDPAVWGPYFWFFLHTVALSYPLNANATTKRKYYTLVHDLCLFIPNDNIAKNFAKLLDECPVAPYLDTRENFVKWVHFIHNKINEQIEKPKIDLAEFYSQYYAHYKAPEERFADFYKWREKAIYAMVILGLVAIIVWQRQTIALV